MMVNNEKPSPHPRRQRVVLDRLKPPTPEPENTRQAKAKRRAKGAEDKFNATQARNQRRGVVDQYRKQYKGKHREGK